MANKYFFKDANNNSVDINTISLGNPYEAGTNNITIFRQSFTNFPISSNQSSTYNYIEKYNNEFGYSVNQNNTKQDLINHISPSYTEVAAPRPSYGQSYYAGSVTIPTWANYASIICVAGGGGGGYSSIAGGGGGNGGGGGGYNIYKYLPVQSSGNLYLQIGGVGNGGSSANTNNAGSADDCIILYQNTEVCRAKGGLRGLNNLGYNTSGIGSTTNYFGYDVTQDTSVGKQASISLSTTTGNGGRSSNFQGNRSGGGGSVTLNLRQQCQADVPDISYQATDNYYCGAGGDGGNGNGSGAQLNGYNGNSGIVRIYWFAK